MGAGRRFVEAWAHPSEGFWATGSRQASPGFGGTRNTGEVGRAEALRGMNGIEFGAGRRINRYWPRRRVPDPLPHQRRDEVLDIFRPPPINEARGKPPDRPISPAQQQRSRIRRDRAAVKASHNGAAFDRCKLKPFCATLRRHRGAPRIVRKSFSQKNFR